MRIFIRENQQVQIPLQVFLHGHVVLNIVVNLMEMKNFNGRLIYSILLLFLYNFNLFSWCQLLEEACVETVDSKKMTKDLVACIHGLKKYEKSNRHFLH